MFPAAQPETEQDVLGEVAEEAHGGRRVVRAGPTQTDETKVLARVSPLSKAPPKKLEGLWDVTLQRDAQDQPWRLVVMTRRRG